MTKRIQDPIHGLMEFDDWVVKFIDTEHFQRLRSIKQLGTSYYVYPGASHNRFEHSLGVAHLAHSLVKRIRESQPNLGCSEKDLKCVTLAALCHDLGHGPFSHLFEGFIRKTRTDRIKWKHEEASIMMFNDILKKYKGIAGDLSEDDKQLIRDLITGNNTGDRPPYLFDIVSNQPYKHFVGKAIDYMIIDALEAADEVLKISHSINNAKDFLKMDDTILNRIVCDNNPNLKKSKKIIKRIRKRKLYKFVDGYLVPKELKEEFERNKVTEKKIVKHRSNGAELEKDDVIVDIFNLNYGNKDENPIDNVEFYDKNQPNDVFKLEESQVSYLTPKQYDELYIRIFTRNRRKIKQIRKCFKKLLKKDYEIQNPMTYYSR
ncbi:unnamed protein product [Rhizophagus irregularis]|nr:unnamed protein product [Rhizophagus irregularis]